MAEYAIYGGDKGKKRLQILASTIGAATQKFLDTAALSKGIRCLDLGCGGGEVSFLLSQITGPKGQVTGYDIDERKIELATQLLKNSNRNNIHFAVKDAYALDDEKEYDLVYSRFLLSHLSDPLQVLHKIYTSLANGGQLLIEETDFSGHFCYPPSKDFDTYVALYQELLKKRGADANLGQHLFTLLGQVGFQNIEFQISHPAHVKGDGKRMAEITFEGISASLLADGIISKPAIEKILGGIIEHRKRSDTIMSLPRVFQWQAIKG